jgi:hypothetical protein
MIALTLYEELKALREGDPQSPMLINMIADVLTIYPRRALKRMAMS